MPKTPGGGATVSTVTKGDFCARRSVLRGSRNAALCSHWTRGLTNGSSPLLSSARDLDAMEAEVRRERERARTYRDGGAVSVGTGAMRVAHARTEKPPVDKRQPDTRPEPGTLRGHAPAPFGTAKCGPALCPRASMLRPWRHGVNGRMASLRVLCDIARCLWFCRKLWALPLGDGALAATSCRRSEPSERTRTARGSGRRRLAGGAAPGPLAGRRSPRRARRPGRRR